MKVPNSMPSHKQGGVKGIIKGSKQPIEFEGGEEFFSKEHTKRMESFMKKGDAKGLGKFVMAKMKQHRSDGVDRKYLAEGDVLKTGLASVESRGDYKAKNPKSSAVGKYQFLWSIHNKEITKVTGIKTQEEFLNNPEAQEKYMDHHIDSYLKPQAQKTRSEFPELTEGLSDEELMALVHFQGGGGARHYLKTGKTLSGEDINLTPKEYLNEFNSSIEELGVKENQLRPTQFTLYDTKNQESVTFKVKHNNDGTYTYRNSPAKADKERLDSAVEGFLKGSKAYIEKDGGATGKYYELRGGSWQSRDLPVYDRMSPEQKEKMHQLSEQKRAINSREAQKLIDASADEVYEKDLALRSSGRREAYEKALSEYESAQDVYETDLAEVQRLSDEYKEIESNWDLSDNNNKDKLAQAQALRDKFDSAKAKAVRSREKYLELKSSKKHETLKKEYDNFLIQERKQRDVEIIEAKRKAMQSEINNLPENDMRRKRLERDYDEMGFALEELMGTYGGDIGTYGTKRIKWVEEGTGISRLGQEGATQDRINKYKNYTLEDAGFDKLEDPTLEDIDKKIESVLDETPEIQTLPTVEITAKADKITETEAPIEDMDNASVQSEIAKTEAKADRLGLRGLVDKYGGVDTALQAVGALAGYHMATGNLPVQRKSSAWTERMQQLKDRTQLGLDNETKTLYQRNAERTYAQDVTNIGRMASSAQSALGALGSASARKYDADMKMGALDADARAKNQDAYQSALVKDEAMTQAMWERNVYEPAEHKRNVKTTLTMDAIENVRESMRYRKDYGEGSLYAKYKTSMIEESEARAAASEASRDYYSKLAESTLNK